MDKLVFKAAQYYNAEIVNSLVYKLIKKEVSKMSKIIHYIQYLHVSNIIAGRSIRQGKEN